MNRTNAEVEITMGKEITYYNLAENDYSYLKANIEEGRVSNAMCSSAQNICERYLKEVISGKANELNDTDIMKTHSLKKIRKFVEANIPELECEWRDVILADGYYCSACYPGEDSYFVDESDVQICWEAVKAVKKSVDRYLENIREKENKKEEQTLDLETHRENLRKHLRR